MSEVERYDNVKANKKQIFINNFTGGIAWALGATVGLAIIFTILGIVVKNINLVPFVGNFMAEVVKFIITKNPQLIGR